MSNFEHQHEDRSAKINICPYLGLEEDRQTCMAYPSEWNACHRAKPVALVKVEHQRTACLSHGYEKCVVFQLKEIRALPVQLTGYRKPKKNKLRRVVNLSMNKRA
ncbi:MAG: hypothetical protein IPP66_12175 [Anaerolineales bacterium]|nr:hypothetical protein [Anaerolineales bacterium]